ncbi:MAG: hypothetical protein J1F11_07225 [Oscillospiraceae bacterium]|nr:hypothetical protein [Oscillospiraceae bacterium]
MKKVISKLMAVLLIASTAAFAGCDNSVSDPGTPPEEVIRPQQSETADNSNSNSGEAENGSTENDSSEIGEENSDGLLVNAVSVQIGQNGKTNYSITMYDNAEANTMLGYLSGSPLLFPTYTYDTEQGFVAQTVRGSYERDDEITVTDVHAGELYLFNGSQLRFYFKDVEGANITAAPIGYFVEAGDLADAVRQAYEDSYNNVWGVEVYFVITKN